MWNDQNAPAWALPAARSLALKYHSPTLPFSPFPQFPTPPTLTGFPIIPSTYQSYHVLLLRRKPRIPVFRDRFFSVGRPRTTGFSSRRRTGCFQPAAFARTGLLQLRFLQHKPPTQPRAGPEGYRDPNLRFCGGREKAQAHDVEPGVGAAVAHAETESCGELDEATEPAEGWQPGINEPVDVGGSSEPVDPVGERAAPVGGGGTPAKIMGFTAGFGSPAAFEPAFCMAMQ